MNNILGCGTWQLKVHQRFRGPVGAGGIGPVAYDIKGAVLQATYKRILNEVSSGSIVLNSNDCTDLCGELRCWAHEVAFYRDGQLQWIGPIVGITRTRETIAIEARDRSIWLERRFVRDDIPFSFPDPAGLDMAVICEMAVESGLRPDPVGLGVSIYPVGVLRDQGIRADSGTQVMSVLQDAAQAGMLWTVYRSNLFLGLQPIGAFPIIGPLRDAAFVEPPTIEDTGLQVVTSVRLSYPGGIFEAGGGHQLLGLHEAEEVAPQYADTLPEVKYEAEQILSARLYPQFLHVTSALTTDAPITHDEIMPGRSIRVETNALCSPFAAVLRIQSAEIQAFPEEKVTMVLETQPTTAHNGF